MNTIGFSGIGKNPYIPPSIIFEPIDPEGLMDSLQNASNPLHKTEDPDDADGFAKRSDFIFDESEDWSSQNTF